jgi:internalin A
VSSKDESVLNFESGAPEWREGIRPEIRKVVLGHLNKDEWVDWNPFNPEKPDYGPLPADLATRFPELTHLHIWGVRGLFRLPELPEGLHCLDVRKCKDLNAIDRVPKNLEELILEELPNLSAIGFPEDFPKLWDLSLKACSSLDNNTLSEAVKRTSKLIRLDLSGCPQLIRINAWPSPLERIDLNGCSKLEVLPKKWPGKLRRLGLRGASSLSTLPAFGEGQWPDYLDLAGTESLKGMGKPEPLRTLFLYGSGILNPPASQHGRSPTENVAGPTLDFFEEVDRCGAGEVKRCKLLMLGNGEAGKTCLSLALIGDDPNRAKEMGSTHAVQFWLWKKFEAVVNQMGEKFDLQIWDFGGQEIYHQTHSLFMSKGSVFVVVWKPQQDEKDPGPSNEGHQDTWRPLQYWFDFIHMVCPWKPRIVLVCSHNKAKTDSLEEQWQDQVSDRYKDGEIECFYVDSKEKEGELEGLKEWLEKNVGELVADQGTTVPSYWEIAQDLVGSWLSSLNTEPRQHCTVEEFQVALEKRIQKAIDADKDGKFTLLKEAKEKAEAKAKGLFLTKERVHRTLDFLTNSGWIYWDPDLFQSKVIIGQQWALDGIYTVLVREGRVREELIRAKGQFTRPSLHEWVWKEKGYTVEEQKVLLSFMQKAHVCFQLVSEEQSWWDEPVFLSFEHLPEATPKGPEGFEKNALKEEISNDKLHRGHWQEILRELGEYFGTDASYARNSFIVQNKEGQTVIILMESDPIQLGGKLSVQVSGPDLDAKARLDELVSSLRSLLPQDPLSEKVESKKGFAGTRIQKRRVFLSYAWNPRNEAPVDLGYEEPVELIVEGLRGYEASVELIRDRDRLQEGDSVIRFMELVTEADKVLVVYSDRFWKSYYCMFELCCVLDSFTDRKDANAASVLIFLEHLNGALGTTGDLNKFIEFWENTDKNGFPSRLEGSTKFNKFDSFKTAVLNFFRNHHGLLHDCKKVWDREKSENILVWVKEQLGLPPSPPSQP